MPSDGKPSLLLPVVISSVVTAGAMAAILLWRQEQSAETDSKSRVVPATVPRAEETFKRRPKPVAIVETQILQVAPEVIARGGPYHFPVFNAGDAPLKLMCSEGTGGATVSDVPDKIDSRAVCRLTIRWKPPEGGLADWKGTTTIYTNDSDQRVISLLILTCP